MPPSPDYAALFDFAPYPFLLIGRDRTLIAANRAYLQATGREASQIIGRHIFEAFPPNAGDPDSTNLLEVERSIEAAFSTGQPHTSPLLRYAVARNTPDGPVYEDRYWSAVHTPVLDADGAVQFVSQNAIDVTDLYCFDPSSRHYVLRDAAHAVPDVAEPGRLQMHEAMTRILDVERNQLQVLFDQSPGFIAVITGRDFVFQMANRAYYQLVGHRDILGKPLLEALPEVRGQGFDSLLERVLDTGEPIVLKETRVLLQREPNEPLRERYVDLVYQPLFGSDGRAIGILSAGSDVTDAFESRRLLAEKLEQLALARQRSAYQLQLSDRLRCLRESGEIFAQAAEHIGQHFNADRVVFGDYDHARMQVTFHSNFVAAGMPELSGTFPASRFGESNFDAVHRGETWASADTSIDPRTAGAQTWPTFASLRIGSGVVVPLVRDGATAACLFVHSAAAREWTPDEIELLQETADRVWTAVERVRAEGAIRAADERKDQFLAMLAHELRNPLAPIRAAAEVLTMVPDDAARVRTASSVISRQVRHMTGLVDDLLDVSRVTRGLVSLEKRTLDIKHVLAGALEQIRPMIEARRHRVSVQLGPADAYVCGDEQRLVQVMANLLNNAAKYTPDGGAIGVGVDVGPEYVVVSVADDGIGMSPDVAARAFELFAQAHRTSDRTEGGLGIGLALVKRLVELHGGSASAYSAGTGAGSEFRVWLPRRAAPAAPDVDPAGRATPAAATPLRVLIVDDNEDAARMLAMLVETMGHAPGIEHTAAAGLERAIAERPDACLLDIGLPDMDGNDLARALRCDVRSADATLVAVTGYGQHADRDRTAAAGFDHHLVKPVDPAALAEVLAACAKRPEPVPAESDGD